MVADISSNAVLVEYALKNTAITNDEGVRFETYAPLIRQWASMEAFSQQIQRFASFSSSNWKEALFT